MVSHTPLKSSSATVATVDLYLIRRCYSIWNRVSAPVVLKLIKSSGWLLNVIRQDIIPTRRTLSGSTITIRFDVRLVMISSIEWVLCFSMLRVIAVMRYSRLIARWGSFCVFWRRESRFVGDRMEVGCIGISEVGWGGKDWNHTVHSVSGKTLIFCDDVNDELFWLTFTTRILALYRTYDIVTYCFYLIRSVLINLIIVELHAAVAYRSIYGISMVFLRSRLQIWVIPRTSGSYHRYRSDFWIINEDDRHSIDYISLTGRKTAGTIDVTITT